MAATLTLAPPAPMSSQTPVPLSALPPGSYARVLSNQLTVDDCSLLRALGLTDHCVVRVCKTGEPCIVQVRTTRIGLARSVADGILVMPEPEHAVA